MSEEISLTEAQLEAITTIDRNVQIIACAGSGKTEVITRKVIELMKNGIAPDNIVAFTFTDSLIKVIACSIFPSFATQCNIVLP